MVVSRVVKRGCMGAWVGNHPCNDSIEEEDDGVELGSRKIKCRDSVSPLSHFCRKDSSNHRADPFQ